jgi:hypothetical protein
MNYLKVDVAKDEGGAVAPPRRKPSLLYLPMIICLFYKIMKTKYKRLRELLCCMIIIHKPRGQHLQVSKHIPFTSLGYHIWPYA